MGVLMPKILVPIDDSPTCRKTIDQIIAHRQRFPEQLTLLHVIDDQLAWRMIPDFQREMVHENALRAGKALLARKAVKLVDAGFQVTEILESGAPRQLIPQIANAGNYELLVIGRHSGSGEIRDVLFGSVANYVLHHVTCPVLLF
ncbi:MAG: universal stress protein [Deltaproteobacteria bacterium]|nr:universal stress protein [Deltaproteobacteria bacterium]